MSFFEELKRRNVFRVAIAYAVAAWLILQLTEVLTGLLGVQADIGKIIVILLVVGFIPVVIFAWAFEITPEGVKREKDVNRSVSVTPQTGKKLDRIIIAGLALVIVGMGVERFWFAGHDTPPAETGVAKSVAATEGLGPVAQENPDPAAEHQESVAVLPFTAMSSGEDDEYFADGLTEEILNSLARLPELLVTARTSSFHFKGKDLPVPEIAKTLGVNHIVEGSVRRAGERVRITAQLIRADDGFHLWSNTYDRTLEDVFSVQEDIAASIAETLDVVLDESKRQRMREAGIGDVEAFILYQKGVHAFDAAHSTEEPGQHLAEANRYFDAALAIVPDIPEAWYLRADLYGHQVYNHAGGLEDIPAETVRLALAEISESLDKAIRATDSAPRRALLEVEKKLFADDWSGMSDLLNRAFPLDDCERLNWMPVVAVPYGWADEVAEQVRKIIRCDPLSALPVSMLAFWETWNGRPEKGLEETERFLKEVAYDPWVEDGRFTTKLAMGAYRESPERAEPNPEGSWFELDRRFMAYAQSGQVNAARELLTARLESDSPLSDNALLIAHVAMGDRDAANEIAARIDTRLGGSFVLAEVVKNCVCGAPFDLAAAPGFRARIEEAGFAWPPPTRLDYPAKDW